MKDQLGFTFIFILLFIIIIALVNDDKKEVCTHRHESKSMVTEMKKSVSSPQTVTVTYEIEWGSYYTGTSSPITYYGTKKLIVSSLGIGNNGLPIEYLLPVEARLPLDINGKRAILYIPCVANIVTGFIRFNNEEQFHLMTVEITQRYDGITVVRASPCL